MPLKRIPAYEEALVGVELEVELSRMLDPYMRDLLAAIEATWPVDTGKSQAAWEIAYQTTRRTGRRLPYVRNRTDYAGWVYRTGQAPIKGGRKSRGKARRLTFIERIRGGYAAKGGTEEQPPTRAGRKPISVTEHYDATKAVARDFEQVMERRALDIVDAYVLGNLKRGLIGG